MFVIHYIYHLHLEVNILLKSEANINWFKYKLTVGSFVFKSEKMSPDAS